jgi:alkylation response protein AidB-like acyl-CoA dehydrogenase
MHEFASKEIRPVAPQCDRNATIPWAVVEKAHQLGITTFSLPREWGGGGNQSVLTAALLAEELAWGCAGITTSIVGPALAAYPIAILGSEEQKRRYLAPFCGPKPLLGALCLTEPQAGSDVQGIATTAKLANDEWVLNGTKIFITNGGIAALHVVFATVDRTQGYLGIRGFIVPTGINGEQAPGLRMGTVYDKLGVRASHTAEVILEDCRIPKMNVLGEAKTGFAGAMRMLDESRILVAAQAVGVARAAYEYALEYAKTRTQFGQPIAKFQGVSFPLAEMVMQIDAARLLVWRAAWKADHGDYITREAAIAKAYAADVAMEVTTNAVQVLGGHGYMKDHPVEKWMRDAKVYNIWEGTAQIQRHIIAREEIGGL